MSKFIRIWNTESGRQEALTLARGLENQGREIRVKADDQALVVDSTSGITIKAGGLVDRFLAQITTANKVAGSAVQLGATGGLVNDSGLKMLIDGDMFSLDATSGLQLDYNEDEFQFVPGTGLQINAVPSNKLPATLVLTDGTRAFTQPQSGVDATAASHLTTRSQVETLISNAISGDFSETIINLAGQTVYKGQVGYVEGVSGSFKLAKADSPTTAKVQYACVTTSVADGASGAFQNPSVEVNDVEQFVSGINAGGTLYLSTADWGQFQASAPSVSGLTILDCGWVKNDGTGYVLFPKEPIDL